MFAMSAIHYLKLISWKKVDQHIIRLDSPVALEMSVVHFFEFVGAGFLIEYRFHFIGAFLGVVKQARVHERFYGWLIGVITV